MKGFPPRSHGSGGRERSPRWARRACVRREAGWRGGKAPFTSRAFALPLPIILFLTLLIFSFQPLSPPAVAAGGAAPTFAWPAEGEVTCAFCPPQGRYGQGGHAGIDIALPRGSGVRASREGIVSFAGGTPVGICVSVVHDGGFKTTYVSLGSAEVRRGQEVRTGQLLGTSDGAGDRSSSSPHLHFGIFLDGVAIDPLPLLQGCLLDPSQCLFLGPWEDVRAIDAYIARHSQGGFFGRLGRGVSAAGRAVVSACKSVAGAAWRWACGASRAAGKALAAFYRTCIEPWLSPLCRGALAAARALLSNRYVQALLAGLAAAAVVCLAVAGIALLFSLSLLTTVVSAVVGALAAVAYSIYYAFAAGDSFTCGGCFLASLSVGAAAAGTSLLLSCLAPLVGSGWRSLGWLGFGKAFLVNAAADSIVYISFCLLTGREVSPLGVVATFLLGGASGGIGKLVTTGLLAQGAGQALAVGWLSAGGAALAGRGLSTLSFLARSALSRFSGRAAYVLFCGCAGLLGDAIVRAVSGSLPSLAESLLCFGGGCLAGAVSLAGRGEGVAGIASRLSRGRMKVNSEFLRALAGKSFSQGLKEGSSRLLRLLRRGDDGRREVRWHFYTGGEMR